MANIYVIIILISMAIVEENSGSNLKPNIEETASASQKSEVRLDPSEIERQNKITQQIFANYVERRLFPHRRPNQKVPTIDEILPQTTIRPKRLLKAPVSSALKRNSATPNDNDDDNAAMTDDDDDDGTFQADLEKILDDFDDKEIDGEALQSVESEQHDQYYGDEFNDDPAQNEIDSDCPNCVDDTQYTNKWTMPLLKLGEKRYYLGIFFKANWFKSTQYCRYHGMHLASISSQEENDRLEKYIRDFGLGHEHFWTSGTDLADEGNFFWMATGRPITFTNWNAGEPNNFRYENGEEENCLELWNRDGKGLKWNDSPCSFETYFVCEVQQN